MNKNNFYEEKLLEINNLLKENKLSDAKKLLDEELAMPYIPVKYEKQFNTLLQDIVVKLLNGSNENKTIAIDSILEMLYGNEQDQTIAIEIIATHNLRPYALEIKKRIESWTIKENIKKSFLFEILAEQEINIDVDFDGLIKNPIKDSILNNNQVIVALESVDNLIIKEPHLNQMIKNEIKHFLLIVFPKIIKNGDLLARQIVNIVKKMQGEKITLSKEENEIKEILSE